MHASQLLQHASPGSFGETVQLEKAMVGKRQLIQLQAAGYQHGVVYGYTRCRPRRTAKVDQSIYKIGFREIDLQTPMVTTKSQCCLCTVDLNPVKPNLRLNGVTRAGPVAVSGQIIEVDLSRDLGPIEIESRCPGR
ncbi:MAG: hypothetical protein DLM58_07525 [Pseudonocardiales bacterium]|nr:MAG: hypothetical protein DLM58_07525 [Pseudonocardiales bacterium]